MIIQPKVVLAGEDIQYLYSKNGLWLESEVVGPKSMQGRGATFYCDPETSTKVLLAFREYGLYLRRDK